MSGRALLERVLAAMIRDTERELRRLATVMGHLDERRNRLRALRLAIRKVDDAAGPAVVMAPSDSTAQRGARAFPIIAPLEWARAPDGSDLVTFTYSELNATQPLRKVAKLTAASARVLAVLESQPAGPDGFPVPLERRKLTALVSALEQSAVDPHVITQRVTRLKEDFAKAGLKPLWIERGRRGVRLLIRRESWTLATPRVHE